MRNHNVAEKHPSEKAIFMNMCMLCDGNMVLALDKIGSNYSGTTFFNDMTNEEFSAFGIGNCEIKTYTW